MTTSLGSTSYCIFPQCWYDIPNSKMVHGRVCIKSRETYDLLKTPSCDRFLCRAEKVGIEMSTRYKIKHSGYCIAVMTAKATTNPYLFQSVAIKPKPSTITSFKYKPGETVMFVKPIYHWAKPGGLTSGRITKGTKNKLGVYYSIIVTGVKTRSGPLEVEVPEHLILDRVVLPRVDMSFSVDYSPKKCDCGGKKARTTHAHWCSTKKDEKK